MRTIKKGIDVILLLLFLVLLGYSFTGGQIHEILGLVFLILIVVHNILNRKWYGALRKGNYSSKRKLGTVINIALLVDVAAIGITGIINSRYLINTGISISNIGFLHTILALAGFVLIVYHLLFHACSNMKKEHKKHPRVLAVVTPIIAVILGVFLLPYLKRHFNTVQINLQEVITGEQVDFGDKKVLIVYFTRVGNSNFEEDVDAVAGASLLLNEEDKLMGNSQVIAQMISDAVGGELLSVNVKEKYPSSYSDTVSVAGKEKNRQELPQLVDMPETIEEYDTVFLVYPLWWWSIPKPVETFLTSYDFSGKTILPVVTHGGSGAGESVEEIEALCDGKVMDTPLEVYCGDIPDCRQDVTEWLKEIRKK